MKLLLYSEKQVMMDKLHDSVVNTISNQFKYDILMLPSLPFKDIFHEIKESKESKERNDCVMLAYMDTYLPVKDIYDYCCLFDIPLLIITDDINYRDKIVSHFFSVSMMSWTELKRRLFFWLVFNNRKENREKIKQQQRALSLLAPDDACNHIRNQLNVNLFQCGLTYKEKQVVSLLTHGLNNHQISNYLNVNPSTTYFHIKKIKKKLNLYNPDNLRLFFDELNQKSIGS